MDFLASFAIVLVGAFVLVVGGFVGLFGALARTATWRWGVFLVGVGMGGVWLRSMLNQLDLGIVGGWLLATLTNQRNRRRGREG